MPVGHEPVDEAGDAAAREQHPLREDAHPEAAAGRGRELEQRVVLGERQAVGRLQLVVEPAGEARVGLEEGPPGAEARVARRDRVAATGADVPDRRSASAESYPDPEIVDNSTTGAHASDRARARIATLEVPMPEFDVEALRARFPGPRHRAGRPPGRAVRRPGRDPGPGLGHRGGRRLLPDLEREPRRPVPDVAAAATRSSTTRTQALADLLNAADPSEIKFGANMTTLTMHVARSIAATLQPGDEIVVTSLDHEANVGPWRSAAADRGLIVRTVDIRPDDVHARRRGVRRRSSTTARSSSPSAGRPTPSGRSTRSRSSSAGPTRPGPDLRRRRPRRAPPADRRPGRRHRLPRLLGLQVLRAARRRPLRARARCSTRCRPTSSVPADDRFETGTLNFEGIAGSLAAVEYIAEVGRRFGGAVRRPVPGHDRAAPRGARRDGRDPRLRDAAVRPAARRPRGDPGRCGSGGSRTGRASPSGRRPPPSRSTGVTPEAVADGARRPGDRRPGGATSTPSGLIGAAGPRARRACSGSGSPTTTRPAEVDRLVGELRAIAAGAPARLTPARDREAAPDVAIIGGGIVGTALAAELAGPRRAGRRCTSGRTIAAGASGRNSGVVWYPVDPVLGALYRETLERYRTLADEVAPSCRRTRPGATSASAPSRPGS